MIRRLKSPRPLRGPISLARFQPGATNRDVIRYLKHDSRFVVRFLPRPECIPPKRLGRDWRQVTPTAVVTHIVKDHLGINQLHQVASVASYDIEVARLRGIALDWVVERMVATMLQSNRLTEAAMKSRSASKKLDPILVREGLARNLRYIEELGCTAQVSWNKIWGRLEQSFPGCSRIYVDPDRHCAEHLWNNRDRIARMLEYKDKKRLGKERQLQLV